MGENAFSESNQTVFERLRRVLLMTRDADAGCEVSMLVFTPSSHADRIVAQQPKSTSRSGSKLLNHESSYVKLQVEFDYDSISDVVIF